MDDITLPNFDPIATANRILALETYAQQEFAAAKAAAKEEFKSRSQKIAEILWDVHEHHPEHLDAVCAHAKIGNSRRFELLQIGGGKKSIKESREQNAERQARFQAKRKAAVETLAAQKDSVTNGVLTLAESDPPIAPELPAAPDRVEPKNEPAAIIMPPLIAAGNTKTEPPPAQVNKFHREPVRFFKEFEARFLEWLKSQSINDDAAICLISSFRETADGFMRLVRAVDDVAGGNTGTTVANCDTEIAAPVESRQWSAEAIEAARAIVARLKKQPLEWSESKMVGLVASTVTGYYIAVEYDDVDDGEDNKFGVTYTHNNHTYWRNSDDKEYHISFGKNFDEVKRIAEDHWNNWEMIAALTVPPALAPAKLELKAESVEPGESAPPPASDTGILVWKEYRQKYGYPGYKAKYGEAGVYTINLTGRRPITWSVRCGGHHLGWTHGAKGEGLEKAKALAQDHYNARHKPAAASSLPPAQKPDAPASANNDLGITWSANMDGGCVWLQPLCLIKNQ